MYGGFDIIWWFLTFLLYKENNHKHTFLFHCC